MRVVTLGRLLGGLFALFGGAAALTVADVPAFAQFGSIFGDPPPRPPARIPGGGENRDDRYPQIYREEPPQSRQYPGPYEPQQQPGGRVQQQPLPPVPLDTRTPPPQQAQPGQPPAQPGQAQTAQPPRQRGTPQPSNTAPQPGDEVIAEPPSQKIPNASAVFSGLDKITGRIIKFDVAINETVQFGALQVVPRVCYTRPPTESQNTNSFVEVSEVTLQGEIRRIFTGWMFASSPGLHAVEHPIYDIWLSDCKDPQVKVAEEPAPAPAPVAAPVPPQRPAQRPQQRAQQPAPPPPSAQQQRVAPPPFFR
jgi:hypothetical protein